MEELKHYQGNSPEDPAVAEFYSDVLEIMICLGQALESFPDLVLQAPHIRGPIHLATGGGFGDIFRGEGSEAHLALKHPRLYEIAFPVSLSAYNQRS